MPASDAQLAANRRNAQSSTGPRTPAGQQAVARNAISHGIFARDIVASRAEHPDDFTTLRAALVDDLQPQGALEELLVEQIATLHWRQRRVLRAEAGAIDHSLVDATDGSSQERTRALVDALQMIDGMGGSDNIYGAAMAQGLRDRLATSTEGQDFLLTVLRSARASLDGEAPLPDTTRRRLVDLLDPGSEVPRLLPALDAAPSADLAAARSALRSALDRRIIQAETHLAALRRRHEEEVARLTARLSLPPDTEADKILRYDKTLGNALARALSTLHRLQTTRRPPTTSPPALP